MRIRRWTALLACWLLCLGLGGCGGGGPGVTAEGLPWDSAWQMVGSLLGVDAPDGVTQREYSDILAASGMCYASWSMGPEEDHTTEDGQAATLYDAQYSLLLVEHTDSDAAQAAVDEWQTMAAQRYQVEQTLTQTHHQQPFAVLYYTTPQGPYVAGASAFAVRGRYALCVEIGCRNALTDRAPELLAAFLEGCHYAT